MTCRCDGKLLNPSSIHANTHSIYTVVRKAQIGWAGDVVYPLPNNCIPKQTSLSRTCPWQTFGRWPEKAFQRHLESLTEWLLHQRQLLGSFSRGTLHLAQSHLLSGWFSRETRDTDRIKKKREQRTRFVPPVSSYFNHRTGVRLVVALCLAVATLLTARFSFISHLRSHTQELTWTRFFGHLRYRRAKKI